MKFLHILSVCSFLSFSTVLHAQGIQESFDYEPQSVAFESVDKNWVSTSFNGGFGWRLKPEKLSGWMTRQQNSDGLDPIKEGSLIYIDANGKSFPAVGNRLQNPNDKPLVFTRALNLSESSLSNFVLDPSTDMTMNRERSRSGIGAPDSVIWISVLVAPGDSNEGVTLGLGNSVYGGTASGVKLQVSGVNGELSAGNDFPRLRKTPFLETLPVTVTDGKPLWLLARLTFGPEWGSSAEFEKLDGSSLTVDNAPQPTGKMVVWVNPAIDQEPADSDALISIPLLEFRFDSVRLNLGYEAAVDEIRLGTSFDEVN